MTYAPEGLTKTISDIHGQLSTDEQHRHAEFIRLICVPTHAIVDPLTKLIPEIVSLEGQTNVAIIKDVLDLAGLQNGLQILTYAQKTLMSLEIRGNPPEGDTITIEQSARALENKLSITVGLNHCAIQVSIEGLEGIWRAQAFNRELQQRPLNERVYIAGRIIDIAAEAVKQAGEF